MKLFWVPRKIVFIFLRKSEEEIIVEKIISARWKSLGIMVFFKNGEANQIYFYKVNNSDFFLLIFDGWLLNV